MTMRNVMTVSIVLLCMGMAMPARAARLKTHDSSTTSEKYGKWGVAGGKYGPITCATCHEPRTDNIKGVRTVINATQGVWSSTRTKGLNVVFNRITSTTSAVQATMGDDKRPVTKSSTNVCEVCHTRTVYHRYSSTVLPPDQSGMPNYNHGNRKDCANSSCHPHKEGFKASCSGCHGNPPTASYLGYTTGMVGTLGVASSGTGATGGGANPLPGAHGKHIDERMFLCVYCHRGFSNNVQIDLGFYAFKPGSQTVIMNWGRYTPYSTASNYRFFASYTGTRILRPATDLNQSAKCSQVYCHGGGQWYPGMTDYRAPLKGGSNTTPNWTKTVDRFPAENQVACGTCHGATKTNVENVANNWDNSHRKHAGTGATSTISRGCSTCHGTLVNNDPKNLHVSGGIFVRMTTADPRVGSSAKYGGFPIFTSAELAPSTTFRSCTDLYCHSDGRRLSAQRIYTSVRWGGAAKGCDGCHGGNAAAARKVDTGAHTGHINNATLPANYACSTCHNSVVNLNSDTTLKSTALHIDAAIQIKYTGAFRTYGTNNFDTTSLFCSNVYCHSDGRTIAVYRRYTSILWSSGATVGCNGCHGKENSAGYPNYQTYSSISGKTANSHPTHVGGGGYGATCNNCHIQTADSNTLLKAGTDRHINGPGANALDVTISGGTYNTTDKTCFNVSGCHTSAYSSPWGSAASTTCGGCHSNQGTDGSTPNYTGSHQRHAENYTYACRECHPYPTNHQSGGAINLNLFTDAPYGNWSTTTYGGSGPYRYRSLANNPYTGGGATPGYVAGPTQLTDPYGSIRPQYINDGRCSTVWCHSNADPKGALGVAAQNLYTSVRWDSQLSCKSCHGDGTNGFGGNRLSIIHKKHTDTTANKGYYLTCDKCHDSTINTGAHGTLASDIKSTAVHVDAQKTVAMIAIAGKGNGSYNSSNAACIAAYCHSNGQAGAFQSYTGYSVPRWNAATGTKCGSCHADITKTGGGKNLTVAHDRHVQPKSLDKYGVTCDRCHSETVNFGSYTGINAATGYQKHVDGSATVIGSDIASGSYASNGNKCIATYCHSDGKPSPTPVQVAWTDTVVCSSCHGTTVSGPAGPLTVPHAKHITGWSSAYGYTCDACHARTSAQNSNATLKQYTGVNYHVNTVRDVKFAQGQQEVASSTCSTLYCHSDGSKGSSYTSNQGTPTWNSTPLACNGCHKADRAVTNDPIATGSHTKHVAGAVSTAYKYGCINCHSRTVASDIAMANYSAHANRKVNVAYNTFAGTAGTYNGQVNPNIVLTPGLAGRQGTSAASCTATYCHSQGRSATDFTALVNKQYSTAIWGGAMPTNCRGCHGGTEAVPAFRQMTSGSHKVHVATYSGIQCKDCHTITISSGDTTLFGSMTGHVNRSVNVAFDMTRYSGGNTNAIYSVGATSYLTNKAPGSTSAYCANMYCHSQGRATGAISYSGAALKPYSTPLWGVKLRTDCTGCHGGDALVAAFRVITSGRHKMHINNAAVLGNGNYRCQDCHANIVSGNRSITNHARHVDGYKQYSGYDGFAGQRLVANGKGGCVNSYCHSDGKGNFWAMTSASRSWQTSSTYGCNLCHGRSNSTGYPDYPNGGAGSATANNHADHPSKIASLTGCYECHGSTLNSSGVMINYTTHISGPARKFNVKFASGTYDSVAKTCTGICHSDGTWGGSGYGEPTSLTACSGCHSDLFSGAAGNYSMDSTRGKVNYKHYMYSAGDGNYQFTFTGAKNDDARRCTMCHVGHDKFNPNASGGTKLRAYNLRAAYNDASPRNNDLTICVSCHTNNRFKAYTTPNLEQKVAPIPWQGLTFQNATSVVKASTHAYAAFSRYTTPGSAGSSTFEAVCTKCHNDSIGMNGEGAKSALAKQSSEHKFGQHMSTINSSYSVFSNYTTGSFFAGKVLSATTGSITVDRATTWNNGKWNGFDAIIRSGAGQNQRVKVSSSTGNVLTLDAATPLSTAPAAGDALDIVAAPYSTDNTCFSCHSKNGQQKFKGEGRDWYGVKPGGRDMKPALEAIFGVFVGDFGDSSPGAAKNTTQDTTQITLTTKNRWKLGVAADPQPGNLIGYILKSKTGSRAVYSNLSTSTTVPYKTTLTLARGAQAIDTGKWKLMKPATHPLDTFGRHKMYERVEAPAATLTQGSALPKFWNQGDTGNVSTVVSTTEITDTSKAWKGSDFATMKIVFPGKGSSIVQGGTTPGQITFSPAVSGLAEGDDYYIGDRHVSCGDCHNTHAAAFNPEGELGVFVSMTTNWVKVDYGDNWETDRWVGRLIKVRQVEAGVDMGKEQIRFITGYNKAEKKFSVSMKWNTSYFIPDGEDHYEVFMGDKWTAIGQRGGLAGSGSAGTWGAVVLNWAKPVAPAVQDPAQLNYLKIENVFDNTSGSTIGGSKYASQRDLCVKCHSYYSYGNKPPTTTTKGPDSRYLASDTTSVRASWSTDVLKEFNPNNASHHAVYARGTNQPIKANYGFTTYTSYHNPNWPVFNTLTTVTVSTSGTVTINGSASRKLPGTVLPGWFLFVGSDAPSTKQWNNTSTTGYLEITGIINDKSFAVRRVNGTTPATGVTDSKWFITAGFGNTFVPPFGPWSILRCTDCHGSTKTDPIGPHASVNEWMLKSIDDMSFEWWNGTSVSIVQPNSNITDVYERKIFCYNCHRRDVYANNIAQTAARKNLSRVYHEPDVWGCNGLKDTPKNVLAPGWQLYCRSCHGGDQVGGMHGTNRTFARAGKNGVTTTTPIKRFLNGAAWDSYGKASTTTAVSCYTTKSSTVTNCGKLHSDQANGSTATYDYW